MNVAVRALSLGIVALALHGALTRTVVTEIVISKSARTLTAYGAGGARVMHVPIGLGRSPAGHKEREGDERTPEGEYAILFKNTKSRFHLSLALSYPSRLDAERALVDGRIGPAEHRAILEAHERGAIPPWKTQLGGEIFIHGGFERYETTAGCVAIRSEEIDRLFPLVAVGTRVRIEP